MKKFLLVCFSFVFALSAWAQEREVSGKVTSSEDGSALPGVNVLLKGTTVGAVTSADGEFKLSVPASGGTLVFSFIGFQSQEVVIGDRTVVDVALATDVQQLNEVVVTAVGITREARTIGYSVANVKNDLLTQAKVTNAAAALSGKVSGLQINQTDNGVNGSVRIVLRGNRSFLGNNQALVVLDGVQVSNDYINSINPNDIESTTILKGATAAALYGSVASNGVMIINTKTGRNSVPVITVSSTTQVESVSYIPQLQKRFGPNGSEKGTGDPGNFYIDPNFPYPYTAYENQNFGPEFNGAIAPLGLPLANGSRQYTTYSQKYNEHLNFFNHATTQQSDISFAVGDKTSNYYVSFQDVNKNGTIPQDKYRRDAFRFNGSKSYGAFTVSYKLQYTSTITDVNFAPAGDFRTTAYWQWINVGMNVPLTQYKDWQNNPYATPSGWYDEYYFNPYWQIGNNRRKTNNQDFLGNLELSLQATKWLNLLARGGLTNRSFHQTDHNAALNFDPAIVFPTAQRLSNPGNTPAGVAEFYGNQKRVNIDFLATASKKVNDFDLRLIAGNNIFDDYAVGSSVSSNNLLAFNPTIYNTAYRNGNLSGGHLESRQRRVSVYGDFTATWKNFLTLHGSFRNDWTSLLAQSNRSFHYPEIDMAFVFTDAIPMLKDNQIISFGKITASWAKVGNVSLNPYELQGVFNAGTPYSALGNVPVLYQSRSVVDANLKPEFTTAKEIGLDMGFWDQKITAQAAYYTSTTTNQTVSFGTSVATGFTQARVNTGEMLNQGMEYDLKITPISTSSGLKVSVGGNYTNIINNKVNSIYTSATGDKLTQILIGDNGSTLGGLPIGPATGNQLNSYAIVGKQYPQLQTTDYYRDPQGRVIVDPVTGLPTRNSALVPFGQTNPKHRLGLWTQATWKGFSFYILFDYRAGNVIYNQIGNNLDFAGTGLNSARAGREAFVWPNSVVKNADGTFTSPGTPNTNVSINDGGINFWTGAYNVTGSNYVTSADFWKLREMSLGYDIPKEIMERTKVIKTAKVTLTGRNLFMWRPKSNIYTDPEFSQDNSNAVGTTTVFQTPPTRLYGVNLTLTF